MPGVRGWVFTATLAVWLCSSSLLARAQITDPNEVSALRAIKSSLNDPLKHLKNWNRGDPCTSKWTGVLCFNASANDGYLHVRELQLLNRNLSGTLAPELGQLSYMEILDFMWNQISGSIPKEIGNIKSLILLLLNGNQLTGPLPDELGYLPNMDRIQIDQNHISGPLPKSFAYLNKTKHFHMNNNSISGQIPPELHRLPSLVHFLLDNNNLSGYLPAEFSQLPNLLILQLDNNQFHGNIPASYGNMTKLLKMSLRNCSLRGPIPDLSSIPNLGYLDLSFNHLNESIPPNRLSGNITTIDLSNNNLHGPIPVNFSGLPHLQRLSLENNSLNGSVPSTIWQNGNSSRTETLILDFQNNLLTNISGSLNLPPNVSISLHGNPVCNASNQINLVQFCGPLSVVNNTDTNSTNTTANCPVQTCPVTEGYEYVPAAPLSCSCAAPLWVGYRLKSPGFSDFVPYEIPFDWYLSTGLSLAPYQVDIDTFIWEEGPRLKMNLKLFPVNYTFNNSELERIRGMFTGWHIPDSDIFGPYELLNFTLLGPYENVNLATQSSGISKGALAGIVLGAIACVVSVSAIIFIVITRRRMRNQQAFPKRRQSSRGPIKIEGVKGFSFEEMALATNNFSSSTQIGQGGYGKVYRGILADGTIVAIKRAQEGSLQGEKEFLTEIELLSRLHHRNLVSLLGYCDEESEQMLVYEFMENGTVRDHISARSKEPLSFAMRLRVALGSAKGILYLHAEVSPPVFHRDIKSSNILLDSKFTAKVADFGLSKLAPVPDTDGTLPGHVSTVVKGTPGYLDPEYFLTHKLTDKSDVYSLGVVYLELLTGMQPISHGKNIVREVNMAFQSGMIVSVMDERMGSYPSECAEKFAKLALKCVQDETEVRPSMAEVVRELENIIPMILESDATATGSTCSDPQKRVSPPSTPNTEMKNPYVSSDIYGSDLVSGVVPTITPR
ncbi:probable LRR receptor-like serine/threonine-protein kinase At1g06840 isoform X5 [Macadamia integrifolia]|uniref:probable LRR receptor-like serine/threonine-protein kinase At1g06840 isoform X5 n=1 Tax=Macadamia integrifolia TaxID=60698 RepID=UPI001C4E96AE|nr:probable LRR receptor-like serine/threonine-protein kinase At1g06840 isoform X5 [Macadamia integrifolia]XP_042511452.1 probable LRR receptor-like serine/threonine-protein kinase At1g06840 isoform X5 [Macadamia integrifolia]XP_042511453.1 probable LRR receptor-like serine/threonine-protein kinase At1g06840 isoform X5 [Macadamia integrifolia]